MIRLYWSDAFQSVYVSQPTTAFLNLLIPLLFQSILASLRSAILDVRIDLVSVQNCSPVSALSSYLFIEWCAWLNASDFRVNCLSTIISYIRNIANVRLGGFWQSTAPVSHLGRSNMRPGVTFTARTFETCCCGFLVGHVADSRWSAVTASARMEQSNTAFVIFIPNMSQRCCW